MATLPRSPRLTQNEALAPKVTVQAAGTGIMRENLVPFQELEVIVSSVPTQIVLTDIGTFIAQATNADSSRQQSFSNKTFAVLFSLVGGKVTHWPLNSVSLAL
jgi:hypothetical protein